MRARGAITAYGPTRTPVPRSAAGSTTAVGWISTSRVPDDAGSAALTGGLTADQLAAGEDHVHLVHAHHRVGELAVCDHGVVDARRHDGLAKAAAGLEQHRLGHELIAGLHRPPEPHALDPGEVGNVT